MSETAMYLKGYKQALSDLGEKISSSLTKNDVIVFLHTQTEWVNEELRKEESWEELIKTVGYLTVQSEVNQLLGGKQI